MPWRQGTHVPINVYDSLGDPVCQCQNADYAELIVSAVNRLFESDGEDEAVEPNPVLEDNRMTCPTCNQEMQVGDWPFCNPGGGHSPLREQNAKRFDPVVVWESITSPGQFSFPGRADEPVPDGYRALSLTNLREADRFVSRFNEQERARLSDERDYERQYWDARLSQRRSDTLARIGNNSRAAAMLKAVAEYRDAKRDRKYARKIDPHFHIQALSFDSGNRQGHSSAATGWKDRK